MLADNQKPESFFEPTHFPAHARLYASDTEEEMRWFDGVVVRKKGLGF